MSNHIKTRNANTKITTHTKKMNVVTVICSLANHNIMTHHDTSTKTNAKIMYLTEQFVKSTISITFILQPKENSLIVRTIQFLFA